MNFDTYQSMAIKTAFYPHGVNYPALGLAGEVGEVSELIKKSIRDNAPLDIQKLKLELGDVLWYLAIIASEHGISLSDIAIANIEKLRNRQKNNTLSGSGDYR